MTRARISLAAGLMLGALAGRAAAGPAAAERYTMRAGQLSDNLLRSAIGIATLTVGIGPDGAQETVPIYVREGDGFRLAGSVRLEATEPVSGWVSGEAGVTPAVRRSVARRYLVVERKGSYARFALDRAGTRKEWVHKTLEWSYPDSVDFVDFGDASTWRCQQLDVFFLAGAGEPRLYERAEKGSPSRPLSQVPGAANHVEGDLVPLQRQGNFFEAAAVRGLNDPKTSIGWVALKDASGRLQIWFSPGPDC